MMFMAFLAGFAAGAAVIFASVILVAMTPEEVSRIIKEERLKHGRQVRTDKRSRDSRKI